MLVLLPIALISGILTVFSPCVLPILPVVLASGADGKKARIRGLIFGIIISFTLASLFLTAFITSLGVSSDALRNFVSLLLFIVGISIVFPLWDKLQPKLEHLFSKQLKSENDGFYGGFITGIGLGIIWTPCVGPLVATISTLAALNQFSIWSVVMVLTYAIGMGVPLWFIAQKGSDFTSKLSVFKKNPKSVHQIFGLVLVFTSIFIYFGFEKRLQSWFLDNLPSQWAQVATTLESRFGVDEKLNDFMNINVQKNSSKSTGIIKGRYYAVDINDIKQGCLGGKDCIPSVDNPRFDTAFEADTWLNDDDVILGLNHNDDQRAYPQKIMNWHEIVNDTIGGDDIAVTFCPLCGTGVSFKRSEVGSINNLQTVEFGVSGKLYESDLVMYDRTKEENWWLQATGEAIAGPAAQRGDSLEWVATTTTTWGKWKQKYPNTKVLSRDTGYSREYDIYPYSDYEQSERLLFDVENKDSTFDRKEVVYGIEVNGVYKAYAQKDLLKATEENSTIEDIVGEDFIVIISRSDADEFMFVNKKTNETIPFIRGFWFSWYTLHTNTEVYEI